MFTYLLYGAAGGLLLLSFLKDKQKTKVALKKAWKSFENILPQILAVLSLIGLTFALINLETITELFGSQSGIWGFVIAGVIGSITLIPGFIAFPLAATLLAAGAGYGQITMFITTLMMVGVITLPVEKKYFGTKTAVLRNSFSLGYAVVVSFVIGVILS